MTKEEISKEIKECEERLKVEQERLAGLRKELDKPESKYGGKRWKPKAGEPYFSLLSDGSTSRGLFSSLYSLEEYAHGNCFKTEEEAEFELERRKVIAELSDFAEGDEAVWDGEAEHWFIRCSYNNRKIFYDYCFAFKPAQLFFPSREAVEAAVEAVGEERIKRYYLGIKD